MPEAREIADLFQERLAEERDDPRATTMPALDERWQTSKAGVLEATAGVLSAMQALLKATEDLLMVRRDRLLERGSARDQGDPRAPTDPPGPRRIDLTY